MFAISKMLLMGQSDAELVRSCQDGQKEQFNELVKRYHQPIYSYIYSRIGDHHTADDVVQEIFISAYSSLERCTEPAGFSSWLFTIARNRLFLWLRDAKHPKSFKTGLAEDGLVTGDQSSNKEEQLAALRGILQSLPDECQVVISMVIVQRCVGKSCKC